MRMSKATRRMSLNTPVTKGKLRRRREGRGTECHLSIALHWQDQPSGISNPGDQGKGMSKARLFLGLGGLG